MYLHLGGETVVASQDVVAIIDLAARQRRGLSLPDMVEVARARGRLVELSDGAPASLVVTTEQLFISPISPLTLRRRASAPWSMDGADALSRGRRGRRRARGAAAAPLP